VIKTEEDIGAANICASSKGCNFDFEGKPMAVSRITLINFQDMALCEIIVNLRGPKSAAQ
jgi:hypothetical protein